LKTLGGVASDRPALAAITAMSISAVRMWFVGTIGLFIGILLDLARVTIRAIRLAKVRPRVRSLIWSDRESRCEFTTATTPW
jgi:hypothetical protein